MSKQIDIRKAIAQAIDEALANPVKGKSLCKVVEEAIARAVVIERAKYQRKEEVLVTSNRVLTKALPDLLNRLFDAEVISKYIN